MRRVIRVVDPVGCSSRLGCCGRWCSRAATRSGRRRPGGLQQLQGRLRGQRATAGSTPSRRSPPNSPAAATASSSTGTPPTRTAHGCGKCRRSPRSCSTANRRRTRCCGRTANGSGWPRSATPTSTCSFGTHVFEIRYTHPRRARPRQHRRRQEIRHIDRRARDRAVGVLLERRRASRGTTGSSSADISVTLPGDVTGAQCSVGFGVGAACHDLTVNGNKVTLSAINLAPRTPVTRARGCRRADTAARPSCRGPTRWDRILGQSMAGVVWILTLTVAFGLGAFLWYRTTVEPSPGFPLQYAPPPGLGPVQTEYIRTESGPEERPHRDAVLSRRTQADRAASRSTTSSGTSAALAERSAWADVDPVSVAVGSALKVIKAGERVRGQTDRRSPARS